MKHLKFIFASLLIAAITTMGFSTKASAQTTYWSPYIGTGTNAFTNGTSSSTLLTNTANWTAPSTTVPADPTVPCPGTTFLCGMEIVVPAGQSLPTFQNILNALKSYYDAHKPFSAGTPFSLTVSSITLTVTVYLHD